MRKSLSLAALPMLAAMLSPAHGATDADLEKSFYPYKSGVPSFPGLAPGTVINKGNVEQFKDALDSGMVQVIRNGWYELKVGKTTSQGVSATMP